MPRTSGHHIPLLVTAPGFGWINALAAQLRRRCKALDVRSRPRERTSSGVGALGPVLRVSVRGRLVAPARLFRFLGRGITGARRLLAFALFSIVASAELCCVLVSQDVLSS
jgi:hypothetical protein